MPGTIVGFRGPGYISGVNVAGDHFHYINDDRKSGGHILSFESEGEVEVQAAMISKFHMDLPIGDDEFNEAALVKDEEGIVAVEGQQAFDRSGLRSTRQECRDAKI